LVLPPNPDNPDGGLPDVPGAAELLELPPGLDALSDLLQAVRASAIISAAIVVFIIAVSFAKRRLAAAS
jgi:hypothetical protein